ncbi:MAG: methionine synthase [Chloroflexi bacterium]|nr:methionine synthase [Chloroflexota bacterium]
MSDPEIRTTVVGSYPTPSWLHLQRSLPALRDAMMVVLKTQELAGIDVIADGELSRFDVNHPDTNGMIDYFVRPLAGVSSVLSRSEIAAFRALPGMGFRAQPAGVVKGPIGEGTLNLPAAWELIRSLTHHPLKFTITSPYMLAKTLLDSYYGDVRALTQALAHVLRSQVDDIDAAVIQLDEANLPGHPEDAHWVHEPLNYLLDGVQGQRAMHLCFGNYGGQRVQQGLWRDLIGFFNQVHVDHLVLEFARTGYADLPFFRDLRPEIALGIGVIDIKDHQVESAGQVARRIEEAVRILGPGRVRWVHPDCGLWMLPRSVADRKLAALVEGRDRFLGRPSLSEMGRA